MKGEGERPKVVTEWRGRERSREGGGEREKIGKMRWRGREKYKENWTEGRGIDILVVKVGQKGDQ